MSGGLVTRQKAAAGSRTCYSCRNIYAHSNFSRTAKGRLVGKCIDCSRGRSTHTPSVAPSTSSPSPPPPLRQGTASTSAPAPAPAPAPEIKPDAAPAAKPRGRPPGSTNNAPILQQAQNAPQTIVSAIGDIKKTLSEMTQAFKVMSEKNARQDEQHATLRKEMRDEFEVLRGEMDRPAGIALANSGVDPVVSTTGGAGSGAAPPLQNVTPVASPAQKGNPFTTDAGEYLQTHAVALGWTDEEFIRCIIHNNFQPEDLIKLCHKAYYVGNKAEMDDQALSLDPATGFIQMKSKKENKQSAFLKAVPNWISFSQLWMIFIGIKSMKPDIDRSMLMAYACHGHNIAHRSTKHPWDKVMEYHLEVHRNRIITKAGAAEWY